MLAGIQLKGDLHNARTCRLDRPDAKTLRCITEPLFGWWGCSAVLAHMMLNERLNVFGILGCVLCIVGSMTIVLHAPEEREIMSLLQVWRMALQPGETPKRTAPILSLNILHASFLPKERVQNPLMRGAR